MTGSPRLRGVSWSVTGRFRPAADRNYGRPVHPFPTASVSGLPFPQFGGAKGQVAEASGGAARAKRSTLAATGTVAEAVMRIR